MFSNKYDFSYVAIDEFFITVYIYTINYTWILVYLSRNISQGERIVMAVFVLNSNLTKSFLKLQHCSEGHLADFFFFDNERV